MLEKLKAIMTPGIDTLIDRLEVSHTAAQVDLPIRRALLVDAMLANDSAAVKEAQSGIATAERKVADARTALRGAIERRESIAAERSAKDAAARLVERRKIRDEALALVDETDELARVLHATVATFIETRHALIEKRSTLAVMVRSNFDGVLDPDGAALNVGNFDAIVKGDMGAAGLRNFGPPWSDPASRRPVNLLERVTSGSALIRDALGRMVPR